jgi:hypothetical protein
LDVDDELRERLADVNPTALRALELVLDVPSDQQDDVLRKLMAEPGGDEMAQLISMALRDEEANLRLRQALRDLGA